MVIVNQGVGVGPGSAARTTRTSRRESIQTGTFSAGQYYSCHTLFIADGPCLDLYGLRTCQKTNLIIRDFLARQQYVVATPFSNVMVTLRAKFQNLTTKLIIGSPMKSLAYRCSYVWFPTLKASSDFGLRAKG